MNEQATNIITLDFRLPKLSKRVKAVKELEANAQALGVKLVRKPVKLDDKWIAWHKSIVNG